MGGAGWGEVLESKVSAKTVIGFAGGAAGRSQLNFVCTCVAGD